MEYISFMIMVISEESKDTKNKNAFVETIISCSYGINESNRKRIFF